MSFNRLNYDREAYSQDLRESVGQGMYALNTPITDCQSCFPPDNESTQGMNSSVCLNRSLVDVSTELRGQTRPNSKVAKYMPEPEYCHSARLRDCRHALHAEDTRLSNPPITLRGTGWNRFEWLCRDPQKNAVMPFDYNVNNRIVSKDNHRPYIQKPIDQSAALPTLNGTPDATVGLPAYKMSDKPSPDDTYPSTTWKASNFYEHEYDVGSSAAAAAAAQ